MHVTPTKRWTFVKADPTDNNDRVRGSGPLGCVVSGDAHLCPLGSFRGIRIMRVSDSWPKVEAGSVQRNGRVNTPPVRISREYPLTM